jgi:hypothetical protein
VRARTTALLGVGLAVLLVVLFGRPPGHGRWAFDVGNAAHGPAFLLVTLIVFALLARSSKREISLPGQYSLAIMTAIMLGALVEVLQHFTGRDAELGDVGRDALGALTAAGCLLMFDPRVRASPARHALQLTGFLVAVTACVAMLAPVAVTAAAYLQRHRSFPTLVDFSSPLSTYFLGVYSAFTVERETLPMDLPGGAQGAVGLHVRLAGNDGWWGLFLHEPLPDWRGYDRLALDLANPAGVPLVMNVNVRDRHQIADGQGRLGTVEIAPHTRRTWTFPLQILATTEAIEPVNTATVHSLLLSRNSANLATEFYVMRIWLE